MKPPQSNTRSVYDADTKVDMILAALTKHRRDDLIAMANIDRPIPCDAVSKKHLLEMLNVAAGTIGNWRITQDPQRITQDPQAGLMLMIAHVAGFAPSIDVIDGLAQKYNIDKRVSPYPRKVFDMMRAWDDQSPQRACWLAFCGDADQIKSDQHILNTLGNPPELVSKIRGTSSSDFRLIYKKHFDTMIPRLPERCYNLTATPFLRSRRSGKVYLFNGAVIQKIEPATTPSKSVGVIKTPIRPELEGFSSKLPKVGASALEKSQKLELYGGGPRALTINMSRVEHVIAGHSFKRALTETLFQRICSGNEKFQGITVRSSRGEGLSFLLAELAVELSNIARLPTYWVIGDAQKSDVTCNGLSPKTVEEFLDAYFEAGQQDRLIVIVDDASLLDPLGRQNLLRFMARAEEKVQAHPVGSVTFVIGVFGDFPSPVDGDPFNLTLTESDERQCFAKMLEDGPKILSNSLSDFSSIVVSQPEYRTYGNDTQAYIDYLLTYGRRTKLADGSWLARTSDLSSDEREILSDVATCGVIGLSMQENVAIRRFDGKLTKDVHSVEDIEALCRIVTAVTDDWRGVGLASPRRAKSILRRMNSASFSEMQTRFSAISAHGLQCAAAGGPGTDDSLDFVRHIFQRLMKPELYPLEQKTEIAVETWLHCRPMIAQQSSSWSSLEQARWAGSLSACLPYGQNWSNDQHIQLFKDVADQASSFANKATDALTGDSTVGPEIAVSLMKAARRLKLFDASSDQVKHLCNTLAEWLHLGSLRRLLELQLDQETANKEYRANEVTLAAFKFLDVVSGDGRGKDHRRKMFGWFKAIESDFERRSISFDAGTWHQRSVYVVGDRDLQLSYLSNALEKAEYNYRTQGTWKPRIEKSLAKALRG